MIENLKFYRATTLDDILDVRRWLGERRPILAIDIETEGLNRGCDQTRLFQMGDGQGGYAIPFQDWKGAIREMIDDYREPMVAHNLLFEISMLKRDNIILPHAQCHDTMVMLFLLNAAQRMDLKGSASKHVHPRAADGQGLLEQAMKDNKWTWATVPLDLPAYWTYGVLDTCLTAMLWEKLWPKISTEYAAAYDLEIAFIYCLRDSELTGVLVDEEARQRTARKLQDELAYYGNYLESVGLDQPGSDAQVIKFLKGIGAGDLLIFKTDKGATSVDKHAMKWVANHGFPIANTVTDWRKARRLLNAYIEKFANVSDGGLATDHILHSSCRPVAARTGRTSITDPPLQQLPRGRAVRDCIVARPGHRFVMADFSNMEMRALASLAQEEQMLAAFARGEDLHGFVAKSLYGEHYTKPQRTICKNGNFSKVYGAGLEKFAATAEIEVEVAQEFLQTYDEMFPGVSRYMHSVINGVRSKASGGWGYVTLQDNTRLPVEVDKAYTGVNFRIQGGCAKTAKRKVVELCNAGLGDWFRLFVHDEIMFEVPDDDVEEAKQTVAEIMPDSVDWPGVILEIDLDVVSRWGIHYAEDFPAYIDTPLAEWEEERGTK